MDNNPRLEYLISTLVRLKTLWMIPAAVGTLLALGYVQSFRAESWSTRQSLIVRDDLLGQFYKPGQFNSQESLKSAQETILEISRKPQVVRNVLTELGPAKEGLFAKKGHYPDPETIEQTQGRIKFSGPNGAEFGKTEVIVLTTEASTPERSKRFMELLLDEIDRNIGEVRKQRLLSMESELIQARDSSASSLEGSARRLRELESKLGSDIGAMRGLNGSQAGDSSSRRDLSQIRIEKRAAEAELDQALAAEEMLLAVRTNPDDLAISFNGLLQAHPKLEALQRSLAEAQQAFAINVGRYETEHPAVVSSRETINVMQQQVFLELATITKSVESRVEELKTRIRRLSELAANEKQQMQDLGGHRVDHLTLSTEVEKKTEILNRIQGQLGEVQAMRLAAGQVQWLTRVDQPQVATRPEGLGKKAIVMAGGICGLMFGLGLVMLVAPPMVDPRDNQGRQFSGPSPQLEQQRPASHAPARESLSSRRFEQDKPTASPSAHPAAPVAGSRSSLDVSRVEKAEFGQAMGEFRPPVKTTDPGSVPSERKPARDQPHSDTQTPAGSSEEPSHEELMRRAANIRPVDLVRPLDNRSGKAQQASADQPGQESGQEGPISEKLGDEQNPESAASPIPDQIKNLADSLANFMKPSPNDP